MMELFNVKKGYREFVERINNINYLPYEGNSAVVNDNYIDNDDKHLPVVRISALVADDYSNESTNYLNVTENTNGDLTKNTDVDMAYDKIIMGDNPGLSLIHI